MNFNELKFRRALRYKKTNSKYDVDDFVKGNSVDAKLIKYYEWIESDQIGLIFEDIDKN